MSLMIGLINKSRLKKYVLDKAKEKYKGSSYTPTRVSGEFFQLAEDALVVWVFRFLESRPSKGKTI